MSDELAEVRLLELPVPLHFRTTQHVDEVQRELLYIATEPGTVPVRLRELSHHITTRFGPFAGGARAELLAARADGRAVTEVTYRLPSEAAEAGLAAIALLDEVDQYCRDGGMLALAAPPEVRTYWRWFLGEFPSQIGGAPPCPWPAFVELDGPGEARA